MLSVSTDTSSCSWAFEVFGFGARTVLCFPSDVDVDGVRSLRGMDWGGPFVESFMDRFEVDWIESDEARFWTFLGRGAIVGSRKTKRWAVGLDTLCRKF
jgi:hypothetical protein